jgi:hypothetical protein
VPLPPAPLPRLVRARCRARGAECSRRAPFLSGAVASR